MGKKGEHARSIPESVIQKKKISFYNIFYICYNYMKMKKSTERSGITAGFISLYLIGFSSLQKIIYI